MKKFKLPKEFALKWIEALRSGKYQQGTDTLVRIENNGDTMYCCLGVACSISGIEDIPMHSHDTIDKDKDLFEAIPEEIKGGTFDTKLVEILTTMNDRFDKGYYSHYIKDSIIFRHGYKTNYTFNEIADWIEDNCEFYDTEGEGV